MLLLLLLIGCGNAEKSVLIIGGDSMVPTATVEQFFPSNMTSRNLSTIDLPKQIGVLDSVHTWVQLTPVNVTHAFLMPFYNNSTKSFFIDRQGHLTPGPVVDRRKEPGLTSIPGENGQMRPIYCGGKAWNGNKWSDTNDCQVMSADGQKFIQHKSMIREYQQLQLIAFGDELIAIGESPLMATERYNGVEWELRRPPPYQLKSGNAMVKLNKNTMLACCEFVREEHCFVYRVDKDEWTRRPGMKTLAYYGTEMVLIDQTVYAFGGTDIFHFVFIDPHGSANVQTLDISRGVGSTEWKLAEMKLQKKRVVFGVWVIDSTDMPDEPTSAVPSEPITTESLEPYTTVPLEPYTTVPLEPYTTVPLEPNTTVPLERTTTVPLARTTTVPLERTTTVTLEPTTTVPLEPNTTVPLERTTTVPLARTTTVPLERTTTVTLEPTTTVPLEPTTTVPLEPTTTVPLEPNTTVPLEPTTIVPLEPITAVPLEPTTTVPLEPITAVPLEPTTTLPLEPTTAVPLEPTTTVPLEPTTTVHLDGPTAVPAATVPLQASKSSSQNWSAAWLLFLILFLSTFAYFVLGVLYRRFVLGARGIQQLPNHSFWVTIYRRAQYAVKPSARYHRLSDDGVHATQQTRGGSQDVELI